MADNWDAFQSWQLVLPPNRPTESFLNSLRQNLLKSRSTNGKIRVAVLGSTPELVDVFQEFGSAQIYVFDKSRIFFERMSGLRSFSGPVTFVEGDWLQTLRFYQDQFRFIASDLTSGNVPYNRRDEFYSRIGESLISGGQFVDRILINSFPLERLDKLDRRYRDRPLNLRTLNDFSSEYLFCSELTNDGMVDSTRFYELLIERFKQNERLRRFAIDAVQVTPRDAKWFYGLSWSKLSSFYLRHFRYTLQLEDEQGTVFSGRTRIFVSGK